MKRLNLVGTTDVAFKIQEGIILGVDSLATGLAVDGPGELKGALYSETYNKMYEISYDIICAMAGHLETAEKWLSDTKAEWRMSTSVTHNVETVEDVADYMHRYRSTAHPDLAASVQFIVAGHHNNVAQLWETSNLKNEQPEGDIAAIGSGGLIAKQFIIDNGYHYYMGRDAAAELARQALCLSAIRDTCTGGQSIKVFLITADGVKILSVDTYDALKERFYPNADDAEFMVEG